ncbi:MAG: glutamyl-tRNA reductase, partial [Candidatus Limnocylindria bacterium]|nr:glutamyl-tRNA reductase [Candidatus Limnocylindria bacterium]
RFVAARRARSAATTIEALHERAERLRRRQLDRALAKLGHLGERDRRVVDALSTGLTRALLHAPTVALREAPDRAVAVRELFGLGERG